jgi:ferredoxin
MLVTATQDTCASSSLCVYRVPEVFDQDEEGLVVVRVPRPPQRLHQEVRRAARGCPTHSIRVEDTADGHS